MSATADTEVEIDALNQVFEDAFGRIFRGEVESDDFNRLVVAARMPADEIVVLRAYAEIPAPDRLSVCRRPSSKPRWLRMRISPLLLMDLFKTRFDPDAGRGRGFARGGTATRDRGDARERRTTCPRTACCGNIWR